MTADHIFYCTVHGGRQLDDPALVDRCTVRDQVDVNMEQSTESDPLSDAVLEQLKDEDVLVSYDVKRQNRCVFVDALIGVSDRLMAIVDDVLGRDLDERGRDARHLEGLTDLIEMERREREADAVNDEIATQQEGDRGLYGKYLVYHRYATEDLDDQIPIADVFVLRPSGDLAARRAVATYAEETDNPWLSRDLFRWLASFAGIGTV